MANDAIAVTNIVTFFYFSTDPVTLDGHGNADREILSILLARYDALSSYRIP